jgi:hypothetical protein
MNWRITTFCAVMTIAAKRHGRARLRVNYRELWILLTGAVGIGLVMFCGQVLAGSLVALLGQYFWIADTWRARAWGKCALSIYFTLAYIVGALRAWGAV